jgi:SAM-dependent methyltransferase|tara:strand:- start:87 stop:1076 length:990 start_codon:yes stop_codon:yes gene_type:complete
MINLKDNIDDPNNLIGKEFDRCIQINDIAKILNVSPDFVIECVPNFSEYGLKYRTLPQNEKNDVIKMIHKTLTREDLTISNPDALPRWERGWKEILDLAEKDELHEKLLIPQYFQKQKYLYFNGEYIFPESNLFEYSLYSIVRKVIFKKYLSAAEKIIDIGCGTGTSILILFNLFPTKSFIGCDWSQPAVKLINLISKKTNADAIGVKFDMFNLEGKEQVNFGTTDAVITMHAMEQLGSSFKPLLNFILNKKPSICLHLEPIYELYTNENDHDQLAQKYHTKRNYLQGFLSELRRLEENNLVEIIEERRLHIGNAFHEHSSLIIWRPTN